MVIWKPLLPFDACQRRMWPAGVAVGNFLLIYNISLNGVQHGKRMAA